MAGHGGHLLGHSNTECGEAPAAKRKVTELMWSLGGRGDGRTTSACTAWGGIQRSAAGGPERGEESATFIFISDMKEMKKVKKKEKNSQLPLISEGKQPQWPPCLLTALPPHALLH